MPEWDATQYLKFADERTRPCRDLVDPVARRLPPVLVHRIVDLGCGPGNSTALLAATWPDTDVLLGLDSSPTMLAAARARYPNLNFRQQEIGAWSRHATETYDLVFANAALQWLPDHAALLPALLRRVAPGGALAFQVPANHAAAAVCRAPVELAASARWSPRFPPGAVNAWHSHAAPFYFDALAPCAAQVELWETEYFQAVDGPDDIVEWYKGSGLRPYLEALANDAERAEFTAAYAAAVAAAYPRRPGGRVLFPFRRRFVIAYR